jgi:peptidoglycan/xylan/chitin deacetylase (PgdA/CDA1 family)
MNISRLADVKWIKQKIQKRLAPKGLILMYHRIADIACDPWSICVSPQHFSEHLAVLKKHAQLVSLQQLLQDNSDGVMPHRSVAITFDDGYADNLHHAKPLLEKFGVPATFFVSTGYLGKEREFWWDELECLLLSPGNLPDRLSLNINDNAQVWNLGMAASYPLEECRRDCDSKIKAWEAKAGSRLEFYHLIWQALRSLHEEERIQLLDQIREWANADFIWRESHRSLLPEELLHLDRSNLVEIGAHTVTHSFLSQQSLATQEYELQESKVKLEKLLEHPVTNFSYPYGDYSSETLELVKSSGFRSACTTISGLTWRRSDFFQLNRYPVGNWNGDEFSRQLSRWFHE